MILVPLILILCFSGYSKSTETVVSAMRANNIKRFVTMTSWYTDG